MGEPQGAGGGPGGHGDPGGAGGPDPDDPDVGGGWAMCQHHSMGPPRHGWV